MGERWLIFGQHEAEKVHETKGLMDGIEQEFIKITWWDMKILPLMNNLRFTEKRDILTCAGRQVSGSGEEE